MFVNDPQYHLRLNDNISLMIQNNILSIYIAKKHKIANYNSPLHISDFDSKNDSNVLLTRVISL
jgi:uncharacterized membrane-anchored protein YjiN (DUF445 family)